MEFAQKNYNEHFEGSSDELENADSNVSSLDTMSINDMELDEHRA